MEFTKIRNVNLLYRIKSQSMYCILFNTPVGLFFKHIMSYALNRVLRYIVFIYDKH